MAGGDRDPLRQVELGCVHRAGRRRRAAGARHHHRARRPARRRARRGRAQGRRPLRVLHGHRHDRGQAARAGPGAARPGPPDQRPHRARRLPRHLRAHRRPRPVRLLHHPRPRRRLAQHRLPRPGRARPARRVLLPRRQVRRDPREVPRLPDHAAHPQRPRRPGRRGRRRAGVRDPAGPGPLGGRRDPRRAEDHQPQEPRGAHRALPGLRLGHLRHRPRRHRGDAAHLDRDAARLLLPPVHGAGGDADRDVARHPARAHRPQLRAVPARRVRPGQLRLLRPHPQRHPGAARPLEARRRLRRGRDRRGGRQGLRLPPLPADVEADDGRAGRQPRHGLPPLDRDARLDGRGHQAEGVRQARPVLPQDRLPDGVPRLLRADHLARRPDGQRQRRRRRSRPTGSSPRSASRSTATSG